MVKCSSLSVCRLFHILDEKFNLQEVKLQHMCTILSSRFDPSRRVLMIVLYIQPNTPSELLFENLDKQMCI
jgi:hypothetical protein